MVPDPFFQERKKKEKILDECPLDRAVLSCLKLLRGRRLRVGPVGPAGDGLQGLFNMSKRLSVLFFAALLAAGLVLPVGLSQGQQPASPQQSAQQTTLPPKFDLREANAVTPIKKQNGGTCWTHGTMAAVESHLLLSGKWKAMNYSGIPQLAEYHLDWWNGFNKNFNEDLQENTEKKFGMTVHQGGDYKVATAYMSRGDGVVIIPEPKAGEIPNEAWYKEAPKKLDPTYKRLYVRDVEWFTMDDKLQGIELIKKRLMAEGAMGTCYKAGGGTSKDFIHYQPLDTNGDPNHSVAIIGWDDSKITADDNAKKPPQPGAWLIKNSWGVKGRGTSEGFMWISYFDKWAARHPEMGAVSFRNVEPMAYDHIYYHDAHGWRDTLEKVSKAFNAYTATGRETIKAVSFFTSKHNVDYRLKIYSKFENGQLSGELTSQYGSIPYCGFHTIDLMGPINVKENDKFYVMVELSSGGHAIDRTSNIPVLLGEEQPPAKTEQPPAKAEQPPAKVEPKKDETPKGKGGKGGGGKGANKPIVISVAHPGESFYFDGTSWKDLYDYTFTNTPEWAVGPAVFDHSANFCIKSLAVKTP
jgi:C1A family cysteine protease